MLQTTSASSTAIPADPPPPASTAPPPPRCFSAIPPTPPPPASSTPPPPRCFSDDYTLFTLLGRGKFARVYKCQHKRTGSFYAAKFLLPQLHGRERVEMEIAVLRQFRHNRNIVGLIDVFVSATETVLVLELVVGGELGSVVGSLLKTEYDLTGVVSQVCNALYCLHYKDVVHKDLKPENLLISEGTLQVKMVDFGLAQHLGTSEGGGGGGGNEDEDTITGTPEFIAPEVLCRRYVGTPVDMWCLGVTIYIALTGISPFRGNSDVETLSKIVHCSYYTGEDLFERYTEAALDFVRKLLVSNPRKRMTAAECLSHPWLTRRKQSDQIARPLLRLNQLESLEEECEYEDQSCTQ